MLSFLKFSRPQSLLPPEHHPERGADQRAHHQLKRRQITVSQMLPLFRIGLSWYLVEGRSYIGNDAIDIYKRPPKEQNCKIFFCLSLSKMLKMDFENPERQCQKLMPLPRASLGVPWHRNLIAEALCFRESYMTPS